MEEYSDSRGGRCKRFRRLVFFLIVSLAVLYGLSFFRFLKGSPTEGGISTGVPVEYADRFTAFLESRGISFRSAGNLELQLDHYNPERLTVDDLRGRFLPDDDRMTPFLRALPELYDIEKNGRKFRLFFPAGQPEDAFFDEWQRKYPEAELLINDRERAPVAFRIFFYITATICFVLTLIIQRRARRALLYPAVIFPAVILSGSAAVLWAAVFIPNMFLSLWRKWAPHREYRMATGVNTVSRREGRRIIIEGAAAVFCAVLPALLVSGERAGAVAAVAMAATGLLWGAAAFERGQSGLKQTRLVFRPLMGDAFRRPLKAAAVELVLGVVLLSVPVGYTVFSRFPAGSVMTRESGFYLPSSSYTAIYEQASRQPRGVLNAVGYLEEKVFQYCYRYKKMDRLPQPGTEVFITEYYYKDGGIHAEKIIAEIFTERGFDSIMKKSGNDPLSRCFLAAEEPTGDSVSVGICLLWILFSVLYFVLLIPFFRIPSGPLRLKKIKGKV